MNNFGFFCKSFHQDFEQLQNLIESFTSFNGNNLDLVISIPSEDTQKYFNMFGNHEFIHVIHDEDIVQNIENLPGWYFQQLVKLYSYRTIQFENYVVLDSDYYFSRVFEVADFYTPQIINIYASDIRTVYDFSKNNLQAYIESNCYEVDDDLFLINDSSKPPLEILRKYIEYSKSPLLIIEEQLGNPIERSRIAHEVFGKHKWLFYQPSQIFSKQCLEHFFEFLKLIDFEFEDIIKLCPWEYNWYGEFVTWRYGTLLAKRVSPVLHFAEEHQVSQFREFSDLHQKYFKKFPLIAMASRHIQSIKL